jgi:hypothetical protein
MGAPDTHSICVYLDLSAGALAPRAGHLEPQPRGLDVFGDASIGPKRAPGSPWGERSLNRSPEAVSSAAWQLWDAVVHSAT